MFDIVRMARSKPMTANELDHSNSGEREKQYLKVYSILINVETFHFGGAQCLYKKEYFSSMLGK